MTGPQIIVLATPVFLALIALEFGVGVARGRNTYRLNDALNSIGLGVMSQVTGVFGRLLRIGLYALAFEHVALVRLPADACGSGSSRCCSTTSATTGCTAPATAWRCCGRRTRCTTRARTTT